jgi:hypothetical protein
MYTNLIATIYSLVMVVLLAGCAATVQGTQPPESDYYEGCEGSWDEIQKCAAEKKERFDADTRKHAIETSPDEMAVIVDSYWGSMRYSKAGIWGVNGVALNFKERVNVPPGKHTVTIYCAHGYGLGSQLSATIREVVFTAKSGHKYQAKCSETDGAWIENTATNEVVGGPVW